MDTFVEITKAPDVEKTPTTKTPTKESPLSSTAINLYIGDSLISEDGKICSENGANIITSSNNVQTVLDFCSKYGIKKVDVKIDTYGLEYKGIPIELSDLVRYITESNRKENQGKSVLSVAYTRTVIESSEDWSGKQEKLSSLQHPISLINDFASKTEQNIAPTPEEIEGYFANRDYILGRLCKNIDINTWSYPEKEEVINNLYNINNAIEGFIGDDRNSEGEKLFLRAHAYTLFRGLNESLKNAENIPDVQQLLRGVKDFMECLTSLQESGNVGNINSYFWRLAKIPAEYSQRSASEGISDLTGHLVELQGIRAVVSAEENKAQKSQFLTSVSFSLVDDKSDKIFKGEIDCIKISPEGDVTLIEFTSSEKSMLNKCYPKGPYSPSQLLKYYSVAKALEETFGKGKVSVIFCYKDEESKTFQTPPVDFKNGKLGNTEIDKSRPDSDIERCTDEGRLQLVSTSIDIGKYRKREE